MGTNSLTWYQLSIIAYPLLLRHSAFLVGCSCNIYFLVLESKNPMTPNTKPTPSTLKTTMMAINQPSICSLTTEKYVNIKHIVEILDNVGINSEMSVKVMYKE